MVLSIVRWFLLFFFRLNRFAMMEFLEFPRFLAKMEQRGGPPLLTFQPYWLTLSQLLPTEQKQYTESKLFRVSAFPEKWFWHESFEEG